jgi:Ca-activated chloride channel family protein
MRRAAMSILALLVILIGLWSTIALAAGGPDTTRQAPPQPGYKVKVRVNTVFLNVSVRDRFNRSIPRLQKEDFLVYEDNVPQEIQQFVSEDAPFYTLLLLDNSGSTRSFLGIIKSAAIAFTARMKPADRIAVVAFNSLVDLMQDFTDDRQMLERAIGKIESIGGTALYDSLLTCINQITRGISGRSAIVVFTDGYDNQLEGRNSEGSRTPYNVLYRRIQEIEPIIYTIFLDTGQTPRVPLERSRSSSPGLGFPLPSSRQPEPSSRRPSQSSIFQTARQQLYLIAEQTGGRMYTLASVEGLSSAYAEIADDLAARYQLAYNPTNSARDGKWRKIRVEVKNHPGSVVRMRKGYYATEP